MFYSDMTEGEVLRYALAYALRRSQDRTGVEAGAERGGAIRGGRSNRSTAQGTR
jgi:hypothetical protein